MVSLQDFVKASAFLFLVLSLFSCASYNQQAAGFYSSLVEGDYVQASKQLDRNRLLRKERNRLLYLLEKGRLEHLLGNYEQSNLYLNEADILMENARNSFGDVAAGTLVNPMMTRYKGEDFEKYMLHYYKALNYLQLNNTEDALVEVRRITLRTQTQTDKYNEGRYAEDAFSLMLQGMIYEKASDYNNAFISFRNATKLYLENNGIYYGTFLPEQLKKDLLRTARSSGFVEEEQFYEKLLCTKPDSTDAESEGTLILFWENGLAPVKREQNLFFSLTKDGNGNFFFTDAGKAYNIPFHSSSVHNNESLTGLHTFRAAVPKYQQQPVHYTNAIVQYEGNPILMEPAQDINALAQATLAERTVKELTTTLTRMAVKKFAEEAVKPKEDEKDGKKKAGLEALSLGLKAYALASEKADTRNWQSLPHSIYFTRIALKKGLNKIQVRLSDLSGKARTIDLEIQNEGGIQFRNLCTLQ